MNKNDEQLFKNVDDIANTLRELARQMKTNSGKHACHNLAKYAVQNPDEPSSLFSAMLQDINDMYLRGGHTKEVFKDIVSVQDFLKTNGETKKVQKIFKKQEKIQKQKNRARILAEIKYHNNQISYMQKKVNDLLIELEESMP